MDLTNEHLPKEQLVTGAIYEVSGTNYHIAVWDGTVFRGPYQRPNGEVQILEENHYDEGPPFGTCRPFRRIGDAKMPGTAADGKAVAALLDACEALIFEVNTKE